MVLSLVLPVSVFIELVIVYYVICYTVKKNQHDLKKKTSGETFMISAIFPCLLKRVRMEETR